MATVILFDVWHGQLLYIYNAQWLEIAGEGDIDMSSGYKKANVDDVATED